MKTYVQRFVSLVQTNLTQNCYQMRSNWSCSLNHRRLINNWMKMWKIYRNHQFWIVLVSTMLNYKMICQYIHEIKRIKRLLWSVCFFFSDSMFVFLSNHLINWMLMISKNCWKIFCQHSKLMVKSLFSKANGQKTKVWLTLLLPYPIFDFVRKPFKQSSWSDQSFSLSNNIG